MKRKPLWVGSKEIHLQPSFPKFFARGDSEGFRFVWRGPYKTLLAQRPARGTQIKGYGGYYVDDVAVEPDGAGQDGPGTMTVTASSVVPGGTTSAEDEKKVEIEAGILEKSIFTHPKFDQLNDAEIAKIKNAVAAGSTQPPSFTPRGDNIEQASRLFYTLLRGVESYMVPAPEVMITTSSFTRPVVGRTGFGTRTTDKPHLAAPDGYVWLKTSDRARQSGRGGKWERVEHWTGADDWDEYLYTLSEGGD